MIRLTYLNLAIASSLLISVNSYAADSDSLSITANITPTSCDIVVDQAAITLPSIATSHLNDVGAVAASDYTGYSVSGQTFTITCGAEAHIGFTVTDGNAVTDSDAPLGALGLGLGINSGDGQQDQDIGYYLLNISDGQVDDTPVTGSFQSRESSSGTYSDESGSVLTGATQYTYSDVVTTPATKLSFKLTPEVYFWGKDKLDVSETHTINGSYTVTAVF